MAEQNSCKYCFKNIEDLTAEGLVCSKCEEWVHVSCLKRGSTPGGLVGDIFFCYTCSECSDEGTEIFARERMPWFQALVLLLYHINNKSSSLARRGYFHWKLHLATLIDQHWDTLFSKDFKRKSKWIGTISGCLSHYSPCFFYSGTQVFKEPGWWRLTFPKLTPNVIIKLNSEFLAKKAKLKDSMSTTTDIEIIKELVISKEFPKEYNSAAFEDVQVQTEPISDSKPVELKETKKEFKLSKNAKNERKTLLPSLDVISESIPKKLMKVSNGSKQTSDSFLFPEKEADNKSKEEVDNQEAVKFMDPMCHYNTSLMDISQNKGLEMRIKLLGGLREETILSPYSSLYLKPYIRRDCVNTPKWLKLMAEVVVKANRNNEDFELPSRSSVDYVYVQPSHIPAINSLCNLFFWPGIDLSDCLQYPDFSCVVIYKKLVVGFAFVVPDVKYHENYISFLFVRPGWRNIGIGRFMMYHLIQTSTGKDLTLHVSVNNPALFLYQKFGFKVEHVELNFYDKYYRKDARESKHAFFCRLER